MKPLATMLTVIGIVLAGVQWWQIVYRVRLYYRDYGGKPWVNHIGDDVFTVIHATNILLLLSGTSAIWAFRRERRAWSWSVAGITVANVTAWLTFTYMHATGVLVEYHEFVRHWKAP